MTAQPSFRLAALLALALTLACGQEEQELTTVHEQDLRSALRVDIEQLALSDLPSRAQVAHRLLQTGQRQSQERQLMQLQARADLLTKSLDVVDDQRAQAGREILVISHIKPVTRDLQDRPQKALSEDPLQIDVTPFSEPALLSIASITHSQIDPRLAIGSQFGLEPQDALGGRSEAGFASAISGFLTDLADHCAGPEKHWALSRDPELRGAIAILPTRQRIVVNPRFFYYVAALGEAVPAQEQASTLTDPQAKPNAEEWQLVSGLLSKVDPHNWLGKTPIQGAYDDAGYYYEDDPYTPSYCPCCFCSSLSLGTQGVARGITAAIVALLPLFGLLLLRRRS